MSTVAVIHRRGTRGTQPLANSVGIGTLYFVTDENIVERSDGTSWQSYSGPASVGGGSNTIIQQIIREETIIEEAIPIPGRDGVGGGGSGINGLVLLEERTASASATLDFTTRNKNSYTGATFQTDFEEYELHLLNFLPVIDAVDLYLRYSTDGGSTFDSGANYSWWYDAFSTGAASWAQSGGTAAAFQKLANSINNTANYGISGKLELTHPTSAIYKSFIGKITARAAAGIYQFRPGGLYLITTPVNAARLLFSSGNIASGVGRIYGIAK